MKEEQKKNDNIIYEDLIGREDFVENVLNLIDYSDSKRGWCFAINGEWGCGKTFVLNMIEQKLSLDENVVLIKYDAWKNDFYKDPLIAILYNLLDNEQIKHLSSTFVSALKKGLLTISNIFKFNPTYENFIEKSANIVKGLTKEDSVEAKAPVVNEFLSYNESLNIFKTELTKITKIKKLVILVDEVDRCSPDYALSVLNRLHNLFDLPNVFVLVAINKQILSNALTTLYGIEENTNYFDKFFDLTLNLSNFGSKDLIKNQCFKFLSQYLSLDALQILPIDLFMFMIKTYCIKNPRKIKQFFERLNFLVANLNEENINYEYILTVAYLWLLKENNPSEYKNSRSKLPLNESSTMLIITAECSNFGFKGIFQKRLNDLLDSKFIFSTIGTLARAKDYCINRFMALLNIFRYLKDIDAHESITRYFDVNVTSKDYDEILNMVNLIDILNN